MSKFHFLKQRDFKDCGATCVRMVSKYYGRNIKVESIRKLCAINQEGTSLLDLSEAAEKIGFRSLGAKLNIEQLKSAEAPSILHWRQNHFVVLCKIKNKKYYIADPAIGVVVLEESDLKRNWVSSEDIGIALLMAPTPWFYQQDDEKASQLSWTFLLRYLITYRRLVIQLILSVGIGSILQLIAPFLTQAIVDIGINTRNLNFIYIILSAQIALIIGRVSVEFIRSWILLHMNTRVNISILTDFLIKLMKLPMSFFDTKMTGDIMQRMNDQRNIQNFLTGSSVTMVFSMFNLLVFSVVLAYYNASIFFVFIASSIFYIFWISLFLNRRKYLNYKSFDLYARNQSSIVQLLGGMQEIKLNNCERQKRWAWEEIQAKLFKFNVKGLALSQYQQGGATFINEGKNIIITFLSAEAVINGHLTLGAMIAVQYIIGQLSSPIEQLLGFIQGFQDAKISLERLNDIHLLEDEEPSGKECYDILPENRGLTIKHLTYRYPGAGNDPVLENIELDLQQGKITAIVGMSGSGKTTLLKLLLRFYEPEKGEIKVGDQSIYNIGIKSWRNQCGVVMEDGFIFSDSIESNIAVGEEYADRDKLWHAIKVANIQDFITGLPLGLNTKIGAEGKGISRGQRQRILIARAVYKNPTYIFFDEATNALDANNETVIMNNLQEFFAGKTVVIVAHRLSTVSNADNIIVLDKGHIVERGQHSELSSLKGHYYRLVKNQLEFGT